MVASDREASETFPRSLVLGVFQQPVRVGAAAIDSVTGLVATVELASVTRMVKLKIPAVFGIPLIVPLLKMLRPGGRLPAEMLHA